MLFAVTASNLGITNSTQNKISSAFNASSRVTAWVHPMDNLWIVNVTDTTQAADLRDTAKNAVGSGPGVFVTPFDGSYAYSLGTSESERLKSWLKNNQP